MAFIRSTNSVYSQPSLSRPLCAQTLMPLKKVGLNAFKTMLNIRKCINYFKNIFELILRFHFPVILNTIKVFKVLKIIAVIYFLPLIRAISAENSALNVIILVAVAFLISPKLPKTHHLLLLYTRLL